ncbi:DAB2 interacting protein b isoform X1 [Tachysurus ichikawai]
MNKKTTSSDLPLEERNSPPDRAGRRRSMPGSAPDKTPPTMEPTAAATPFRVTVSCYKDVFSDAGYYVPAHAYACTNPVSRQFVT